MIIKTDEQIALQKESCRLVSLTHEMIAKNLKVGITGLELDKLAEEFIRDHNAIPSFKGFHGFPFTLCVSPNQTVVHGFSNNIPFKETDMVSIDCGVYFRGYHGDCAYTYAFAGVSDEVKKLMRITKESLYIGIDYARAGVKTGDMGHAIQSYCEKEGYGVVRSLVGHGVGKDLHEPPEVPNFGKPGKGVMLKKNVVIAIEPMINMGTKDVVTEKDQWTINTKDGKPSAHYEHTLKVGLDKAEVLTDHSFAEEAIKTNEDLIFI
jgi:methionyl aminopeptidase